MSTYGPHAVQEGLDSARISRLRTASKLRVETPDGYFRVLDVWDSGFSVAVDDAPALRGYVDLYDGPSHLVQGLVVASEETAGEMKFEFKRMTAVSHTPPSDYVRETPQVSALLTSEF